MYSESNRSMYEKMYEERFKKIEFKSKKFGKYGLIEYVKSLKDNLQELITEISGPTFWLVFPKILGVDAKLSVLESLLNESLSELEIIELVSNDYRKINQENFGFRIDEETPHALIFFIE